MKGYIFEYYKYVRYTEESLEGLIGGDAYEEAKKSILTFGDYDRLTINTVEDFARFRDLSSLAKKWVGNRQSILLYDLEDNPQIVYQKGIDRIELIKDGKKDDHLFWALTEFPFRSCEREDMQTYKDLLNITKKELSENINERIENDNYQVDYTFYGTLGTFGIVVFWMGNQFTEILNLVNTIKKRHKGKFLSARTIFSKNPLYNDITRSDDRLRKMKGKAFIEATLKKHLEDEDISRFFDRSSKVKALHTPGEYDIVFEVRAQDAYYLFENNDYFNHDTTKYQERYLQTKIILGKQLKVERVEEKNANEIQPSVTESYAEDLKNIDKVYKKVRGLMEQKIVKTAGLIDTLDSLVFDYRSNVVSAVNENWAKDFSYIFQRNLECIESLLRMNDNEEVKKRPQDILVLLRIILNNLKQQILHITEAHNLNFEYPKCHLRYTGQEDGLMFCYMGIIKEILKEAYRLKGYNMQSEIIPLVTVDVVPIIESELYFDKTMYVKKNSQDQKFKILSLNLPHVSFYEIPIYFQYMYHEIFHYITPFDREIRDYKIGIILTTLFISDILSKYFKNILELKDEGDKLGKLLLPIIFTTVDERYKDLHEAIVGKAEVGNLKRERDVVLFISEIYKEAVMDYLEQINENTFIKDCLFFIWDKLQKNDNDVMPSIKDMEAIILDTKKRENIKECFLNPTENKGLENIIKDNQMELREHLGKFLDGLKESAADLPMIELTKMSLSEYLLFYVNCLENIMMTAEMMESKKEIKEQIRIGIILGFYSSKAESIELVKETFIYKYIAKYFNMNAKTIGELRDTLDKLRSDAEKWLDFFEKCLERNKQQYGVFSAIFRDYCNILSVKERLCDDKTEENRKLYFEGYRNAIEGFANVMRQIHEKIKEGRTITIEQCCNQYSDGKQKYIKVMFNENIKLFQYFQKQEKLQSLYEINEEINKEKQSHDDKFEIPRTISCDLKKASLNVKKKFENVVSDFESLAREIKKAIDLMRDSTRRLLGKNNLIVWYRGQENAAYGLLPSIARRSTTNKRNFNYLAQYQRYLFGEFKFRSDGAAEMQDPSHYTISDYLALMQHYGVRTNLMDWSENAFTALYFALEEVLTRRKNIADTSAALWIFSPQLYNEARKYMIVEEAMKEPSTESAFKASLRTVEGYDGIIPNISVEHNEKIFDMFLLGNVDYESPNQYGYKVEKKLAGHEEMAYLPLAVYTSRLNPRVQTQSGMFVAFNLYAEPAKITDYDYMGLEKIQEYYLEYCNRERKEPFLYKIIIDKSAIKEIAECVENLGFNKSKVYPELFSVGERIK